jgi:hypothetical protein
VTQVKNEDALVERIVDAVTDTSNKAYEKALNAHLKTVLDKVNKEHKRICPFSVEDVAYHVPHVKGIIRDLGKGQEEVGLRRLRDIFAWCDYWECQNEEMKKAVTWSKEVQDTVRRYKIVIGGVIIVTLLSGLGQLLVAGWRIMMMTNGGQ